MHKKIGIVALTMVMLIVMVVPAAAKVDTDRPPLQTKYGNSLYIVQMIDAPVVAYDGGIPGLAATKPNAGQKINPNNPDVIRYAGYLNAKHNQALRQTGGRKIYDYVFSFNGFAAELNASQADEMKNVDGVVVVTKDEIKHLDTSSTPAFLGLDEDGGLWDMLGGAGSAGENIVIGIIDGGIWPEHPSFSDRTGTNPNGRPGKLSYQQLPGWHGRCEPGEAFRGTDCNQKLIGARYYNAGWGGNAGVDAQLPWEYNSPRDFGGHGTHTASTSGGNYGVPATGQAAVFGAISGIAPRARIAAYKVCWETPGGGSCFNSDSVAAIDQAVADGVDVMNYSISGTRTNFLDPVEVAFLFAARAGVFVSVSAGNEGPTASTVAHPSPWLTTVAATSHNRSGNGSVTLGNGATYLGASVATAVPSSPLVDSINVGAAGADPGEVELCYPGTLDPALVSGKIVVCRRGVIARVDKSLAVSEAGGVGMILYNSPDSSLNADFHFVPTVHVNNANGLAIKAYIAAEGAAATASIAQATIIYDALAPLMASFSSRGPLLAGGGDLLKPDMAAPGVDVLAGVAPPGNAGRLFDLYSGTSMAAPHVAGLGALMKNLHPDWSPMMIKSALMTTARQTTKTGVPGLVFSNSFGFGAGQVEPNSAADPGLVFDSGWLDWLAFLCGSTSGVSAATCTTLAGMGYSFDRSDLNLASIAIGDLAGEQTVTRKATNVGDATTTYSAAVSGLAGIDVVVSPDSMELDPGETGEFTVSFTTNGAAMNTYVHGALTWSDGTYNVRMPLVVKPVPMAFPAEVEGSGAAGSLSFDISFGYNGAYTAGVHGLNPASTYAGNVQDDPSDDFDTALACYLGGGGAACGITEHTFTVNAGAAFARFSLFDAYTDGTDDLDLYVFKGGAFVGGSGSGTSAEEVNVLLPAAGDYTVYVHGWQPEGADSNYTLFAWQFGLVDDAGNMTVTAPAAAVLGPDSITVDWAGLSSGMYLGAVSHSNGVDLFGLTLVNITVP